MQPSIYFCFRVQLFVQLSPLLASLKKQDPIHSSFHKFGKNDPFQVEKKIIKK